MFFRRTIVTVSPSGSVEPSIVLFRFSFLSTNSHLPVKFKEIVPEELQRAKDHIAGKMAIDLEDTSAISIWYGVQELVTGEILEPNEKIEKIMAVTLEEIMEVGSEIINFQKSNLAIIGPFKEEDKFRKLLL